MRSTILLLVGAVSGIILAASGLLEDSFELSYGGGAVASVNGVEISAEQYTAVVDAISAEKKTELTDKDYQFLLQKLIDEELIVQRGEELGFLQLNSVVRNNLVQAVISSIMAEAAVDVVDDETLQDFYQANQSFFIAPTKMRVSRLKFKDKNSADLAQSKLLSGAALLGVKTALAEQEILKIPNILLPLSTLREYIGPSLLEVVNKMEAGEVSDPVAHQQSWYLFMVHEKQLPQPPAFESIRGVVLAEYKRKQDEKAFRKYVEWLRQRADLDVMDTSQLKLLWSES